MLSQLYGAILKFATTVIMLAVRPSRAEKWPENYLHNPAVCAKSSKAYLTLPKQKQTRRPKTITLHATLATLVGVSNQLSRPPQTVLNRACAVNTRATLNKHTHIQKTLT